MMPTHSEPPLCQQITNYIPADTPPQKFDLEAILPQVNNNTAEMDRWTAKMTAPTTTTLLPTMLSHSAPTLPNQQKNNYLSAETPPRATSDLEALLQQVRQEMAEMD